MPIDSLLDEAALKQLQDLANEADPDRETEMAMAAGMIGLIVEVRYLRDAFFKEHALRTGGNVKHDPKCFMCDDAGYLSHLAGHRFMPDGSLHPEEPVQ